MKQTAGPDPKQITVPPGVFRRPTGGAPSVRGVAPLTPLFQIRTRLDFSGPAPALGSAVLKAGGRTGAAITTFTAPNIGAIRYAKTAAQFGGPMQTKVVAASPIRLWAHGPAAMAPCKHFAFAGSDGDCIALLVEPHPGPLVAAGASVGFAATSPGKLAMSPRAVVLSVPNASGLVAMSAALACSDCVITDQATLLGFPWTTGGSRSRIPRRWEALRPSRSRGWIRA